MSSTRSWSGVGLSPPGASSPTDSADCQSASTSPAVIAGPPLLLFESLSRISARPDFADEAVRSRSRLDGIPCTSATVFRGRSRFGLFFGDGAVRAPAVTAAVGRFLAAVSRRPWGLALASGLAAVFTGLTTLFAAEATGRRAGDATRFALPAAVRAGGAALFRATCFGAFFALF